MLAAVGCAEVSLHEEAAQCQYSAGGCTYVRERKNTSVSYFPKTLQEFILKIIPNMQRQSAFFLYNSLEGTRPLCAFATIVHSHQIESVCLLCEHIFAGVAIRA